MCNINILIKNEKNQKTNSKIYKSFCYSTASSFVSNSDGNGVFVGPKVKKQYEYIDISKEKMEFSKNNIIITHQRIATKGFSIDNLQPFISEDKRFVFVHNGIISEQKYNRNEKISDSKEYFIEFQKTFEKTKSITKTIKKITDGIEGSYSIAIYDRNLKKLFYYKSNTTNISFYMFDNSYLYITTKDTNKNLFSEKYKEIEIKPYIIYEISLDLSIYNIGKIKKPKNTYTNYYTNYYNKYNEFYEEEDIWKNKDKENEKRLDDYY